MKMASMALPKEEMKGKMEGCDCCSDCKCESDDKPRYPWGTQIRLEDEQLSALGINGAPAVGSIVSVSAMAKVTSVSQNEMEDGTVERCVTLQITDMGMEPERKGIASVYNTMEQTGGAE